MQLVYDLVKSGLTAKDIVNALLADEKLLLEKEKEIILDEINSTNSSNSSFDSSIVSVMIPFSSSSKYLAIQFLEPGEIFSLFEGISDC